MQKLGLAVSPLLVVTWVLSACSSAGTTGSPASASTSGALVGQAECNANRSAGPITFVSPFGFDASAGIIDVFAAQSLGYFKDLCLTTTFVTNSQDATTLVSAGTATTTAVGSAADFMVAAANGSKITAVATYGDVSDYCIITQAQFTSLRALEGHTLGYHFSPEAPDLEMLVAAGADLSKIQLVNTPDYDPNQVVQGHLDSVGCYQSNEPLTLRAEGAKFNEFTPSQFGVSGTYNVEFFNDKFLAAHYGAAKDWMRADLHAFAYCEAHQAQCISIEQRAAQAAGAEFVVSHEQQVWALEAALSKNHTLPGQGIGVESRAEWQPEVNEVQQFKLATNLPALSSVENTTMVASLYSGKDLIWP
jgi:hypothetical protein